MAVTGLARNYGRARIPGDYNETRPRRI